MSSSKGYLDYVLDCLSHIDDISYRGMMGEYVIYFREKVIGGIYDDRFLVKPVESAKALMPDALMEIPYDGSKPMLLVDRLEERDFMSDLLYTMYAQLPFPKPRRNKQTNTKEK